MIYYLGSTDILRSIYTEEYDRGFYIPTRVDRGIKVKMLSPDTPMMRSYQATDTNEDRETRCLHGNPDMKSSVMIYDDKVVYFTKEGQLTALTITSASIAETMKQIFGDLWDKAK